MEIKVIKFGGTATKTKKEREKVINNIKELLPCKVLVIVSAMGRNGFPYATDTLKELISEEHITKKELDRLLSCGETIASIVLTSQLNQLGIKTYSVSLNELGLISNNNYGDAYVEELNNDRIVNLFNEYDVLLAPGFVCLSSEKEPATFKRGGSDLSAVLLANVMGATEVILYKDVDGIYPIHPMVGNSISHLEHLSYEELLALLDTGYAVVQKDALEEARQNNIKLIIKNYSKKVPGTIIDKQSSGEQIIGLSVRQNEIRIATFFQEEIKNTIEIMLRTQHIYLKEVAIQDNLISLKLSSSQVFLAKRLIINKFLLKKTDKTN